jgi:hypothetical protein
LNQEEASPKVLILPGPITPMLAPVFETRAVGFDEVGQLSPEASGPYFFAVLLENSEQR